MGWIGVDLDGTLAHYDEWKGENHIGAPIPAMIDRVKQWLSTGKDVRIFTARMAKNQEQNEKIIQQWLIKNIGQSLPVTNIKDQGMEELWDDRAIQVEKNTGIPITQNENVIERGAEMPWEVKKQGDKYAIVKKTTGEIVGHSDTKENALASVRARYANMSAYEKAKEKYKGSK